MLTPVLAQVSGEGGGSLVPLLILVVVLILLNGALAGSEVALVSLREGQLTRFEERGGAGRVLAQLAREPNRFISTIQIGITLSGFLAAGSATQSLAAPLQGPLSFLGDAAQPAAFFLVTLALTFVTLVVGELAPKRIALQRPEGWGLLAARPLALLSKVTAPLVWVLSTTTDLVVRLVGIDPGQAREEVSEEELRDMVSTQASFTPEQRTIISGAFEIAERSLREIVVPRRSVKGLPADVSVEDAMRQLVEAGHSRAPVYRNDLDDVLGVVHLRDLVHATGPVGALARPMPALPETAGVLDALRRFQAERLQMVVVVDEHGGTEGIITLEDLLEEIVGEIYDEFDRDLDSSDPRGVQRADDGSLRIPGSFPVHDLVDLGVAVPDGEYATVAGLVLQRLGRIPEPGATVDLPGWRLEVLSQSGHTVGEVHLVPDPDPAPATSAG